MKKRFLQLSNKVIKSVDGELFFTKAEGSMSFQKTFFGEEDQYGLYAQDVYVGLNGQEGTITDAVLLTFWNENEESSHCVEVLICDLLGTFISDWH